VLSSCGFHIHFKLEEIAMLSREELTQLCQKLGLSKQAQTVIEEIRSSPPARQVNSAAGNVCVRYPSRKMGVTIQAESHRNELAGIYEKEHDSDTLEYYDQPPQIKLVYQAKSGRQVGVLHTPDFFVIRTDSVGWEEWKMEEELVRLADKMPHRYVSGEDERWYCPPGEWYAKQFGFFYHVRSSADIDWVFQRNILFLEDYLRADCPPVGKEAAEMIAAFVTSNPGITLDELLGSATETSSDDVYSLIATEQVYVDMRAAPLAEPGHVYVFQSEEEAYAYTVIRGTPSQPLISGSRSVYVAAGTPVVWDGRCWEIVNLGETTTALLADDGTVVELPDTTFESLVKQGKLMSTKDQVQMNISAEARELLARASPDDFKEANRRYAIIAPRLNGRPIADGSTPARTVRHWLSKWREAEQMYGCGYVGLLPQRWRSGNYNRKLPENTLAILDEFIVNDYERVCLWNCEHKCSKDPLCRSVKLIEHTEFVQN
jgi:putative transposase